MMAGYIIYCETWMVQDGSTCQCSLKFVDASYEDVSNNKYECFFLGSFYRRHSTCSGFGWGDVDDGWL